MMVIFGNKINVINVINSRLHMPNYCLKCVYQIINIEKNIIDFKIEYKEHLNK